MPHLLLLYFFIFLLIPQQNANGDTLGAEPVRTDLLNQAQQHASDIFTPNTKLQDLLKQAEKISPEIVQIINNNPDLSDEEKTLLLRSHLAEKAYEFYKVKFISDLRQRSQETGRQIKTFDHSGRDYDYDYTEYTYHLDRGKLDTPECNRDGWDVCYFPDGFEEFSIRIQNTSHKTDNNINTIETLYFFRDFPTQDERLTCSITFANNTSLGDTDSKTPSTQNASIDVGCQTYKYTEYHTWRNNQVADVLAGGYDLVNEQELAPGNPFGTKMYSLRMNENPSQWKSSVHPGVHITGITADYHYNSNDKK